MQNYVIYLINIQINNFFQNGIKEISTSGKRYTYSMV